jgi:hypothetical protein
MQIEHVHLLVNMQKCTCKICNFDNLVILHICKHEFVIWVIIIILNWEAFNFIIFEIYKCAHAIYELAILKFITL